MLVLVCYTNIYNLLMSCRLWLVLSRGGSELEAEHFRLGACSLNRLDKCFRVIVRLGENVSVFDSHGQLALYSHVPRQIPTLE